MVKEKSEKKARPLSKTETTAQTAFLSPSALAARRLGKRSIPTTSKLGGGPDSSSRSSRQRNTYGFGWGADEEDVLDTVSTTTGVSLKSGGREDTMGVSSPVEEMLSKASEATNSFFRSLSPTSAQNAAAVDEQEAPVPYGLDTHDGGNFFSAGGSMAINTPWKVEERNIDSSEDEEEEEEETEMKSRKVAPKSKGKKKVGKGGRSKPAPQLVQDESEEEEEEEVAPMENEIHALEKQLQRLKREKEMARLESELKKLQAENASTNESLHEEEEEDEQEEEEDDDDDQEGEEEEPDQEEEEEEEVEEHVFPSARSRQDTAEKRQEEEEDSEDEEANIDTEMVENETDLEPRDFVDQEDETGRSAPIPFGRSPIRPGFIPPEENDITSQNDGTAVSEDQGPMSGFLCGAMCLGGDTSAFGGAQAIEQVDNAVLEEEVPADDVISDTLDLKKIDTDKSFCPPIVEEDNEDETTAKDDETTSQEDEEKSSANENGEVKTSSSMGNAVFTPIVEAEADEPPAGSMSNFLCWGGDYVTDDLADVAKEATEEVNTENEAGVTAAPEDTDVLSDAAVANGELSVQTAPNAMAETQHAGDAETALSPKSLIDLEQDAEEQDGILESSESKVAPVPENLGPWDCICGDMGQDFEADPECPADAALADAVEPTVGDVNAAGVDAVEPTVGDVNDFAEEEKKEPDDLPTDVEEKNKTSRIISPELKYIMNVSDNVKSQVIKSIKDQEETQISPEMAFLFGVADEISKNVAETFSTGNSAEPAPEMQFIGSVQRDLESLITTRIEEHGKPTDLEDLPPEMRAINEMAGTVPRMLGPEIEYLSSAADDIRNQFLKNMGPEVAFIAYSIMGSPSEDRQLKQSANTKQFNAGPQHPQSSIDSAAAKSTQEEATEVHEMTPKDDGALASEIRQDSPNEEALKSAGDVIVEDVLSEDSRPEGAVTESDAHGALEVVPIADQSEVSDTNEESVEIQMASSTQATEEPLEQEQPVQVVSEKDQEELATPAINSDVHVSVDIIQSEEPAVAAEEVEVRAFVEEEAADGEVGEFTEVEIKRSSEESTSVPSEESVVANVEEETADEKVEVSTSVPYEEPAVAIVEEVVTKKSADEAGCMKEESTIAPSEEPAVVIVEEVEIKKSSEESAAVSSEESVVATVEEETADEEVQEPTSIPSEEPAVATVEEVGSKKSADEAPCMEESTSVPSEEPVIATMEQESTTVPSEEPAVAIVEEEIVDEKVQESTSVPSEEPAVATVEEVIIKKSVDEATSMEETTPVPSEEPAASTFEEGVTIIEGIAPSDEQDFTAVAEAHKSDVDVVAVIDNIPSADPELKAEATLADMPLDGDSAPPTKESEDKVDQEVFAEEKKEEDTEPVFHADVVEENLSEATQGNDDATATTSIFGFLWSRKEDPIVASVANDAEETLARDDLAGDVLDNVADTEQSATNAERDQKVTTAIADEPEKKQDLMEAEAPKAVSFAAIDDAAEKNEEATASFFDMVCSSCVGEAVVELELDNGSTTTMSTAAAKIKTFNSVDSEDARLAAFEKALESEDEEDYLPPTRTLSDKKHAQDIDAIIAAVSSAKSEVTDETAKSDSEEAGETNVYNKAEIDTPTVVSVGSN